MPQPVLPKPDMGSVETRELRTGTTYRAVWRAGGNQQKKAFDSYQEALDFLNEMAIEVRRGGRVKNVRKSRLPFEAYAAQWLAGEAKDVKKKTSIVNCHLTPAFGKTPMEDINRAQVQAWVNGAVADPSADCDLCEEVRAQLSDDDARCRKHKATRPVAVASLHTHYAVLSKLMKIAQIDGYLPNGSPVGKGLIDLPTVPKRMIILNHQQGDHLLAVVQKNFPAQAAMVHVASHTGMRLGELVGLPRNRFQGTSLLIDCARKNDGNVGGTKTESIRRIALDECCIKVLVRHLAEHDNALVFPSPEGHMWVPSNWRRRYWYKMLEDAGLGAMGLHFHDLRHTHCTNLLEAGWDVVAVAERLGHASAKMTLDRYGHARIDRQANLLALKGLRAS